MALMKCGECGGQVSSEAKACPACGAPPPDVPRKTSTLTWVLGGLFGVGVVSAVVNEGDRPPPVAPRVALSPADQAAETEREARFVKATLLARAIKQGMKNPDSFKLESAFVTDVGAMCFEFRGTNSFNAVVPGSAVVSPDGKKSAQGSDGEVAALWNKHCSGARGVELAKSIRP